MPSLLEILGFILGIGGVILTIRQSPFCWPISALNVIIYALLFFKEKLYADSLLQLVYLIISLYGWYYWTKGAKDYKPNSSLVKVGKANKKELGISFIIVIVFAVLLAIILKKNTDAAYPMADSFLTGISLWAQYLQTKKKIENWYLWIMADILYVVLFMAKGLYPSALLFLLYAILAIRGLQSWKKSLAS